MKSIRVIILIFLSAAGLFVQADSVEKIKNPLGWASNSINAIIFRKNAVVTYKNTQFIAFYDSTGTVCLGKRKTGESEWEIKQTPYKGNVYDAHNTICIMTDGAGYLHIAWNHHGNPLNYTKSKKSLSLDLQNKQAMTGILESNVTYPEFYQMPGGNILFMYRDGQSGNGNLGMKMYNTQTGKWQQIQDNLVDGEGERNAYRQACIDAKGTIHLSWVWRETPDVASNHDLCYARSCDGGKTWENHEGKVYSLPITAATAEYACRIPQNSELINQTSMCADETGIPYIATYYRMPNSDVPQYHVIYPAKDGWKDMNLNFPKTPFTLRGGGTKRIPISRPQILVTDTRKNENRLILLFRDEERDNKVSLAICNDIENNVWNIRDLTDYSVGEWEPAYDTELWKNDHKLSIFIQKVEQPDGGGTSDMPPQPITILDVPQ